MENLSKAFSLLAFADESGPSASPPSSSSSSSTGIFRFRISGVRFMFSYIYDRFIFDEDLKSSSEKERGIRSKSVKNMKLRKAKEANQDIGDHSLHLKPLGELIPSTKLHWISQILHHLNWPFLEPICFKSRRLVFYTFGCDLAICFINQKLPKAPRIFPKLSRYKQLNTFSILAEILSFKPNG
ncbi:hypothetical protein F2Q70_00008993 [Brassica cretica]|uniref:Uncharacterized protein n=1 Tax=Brassica cretica TaxID=69181 RepID=A0A8S9M8N2_BRACR|nr:hypothetical protein F2Q70_00008993 [Brassica cretica]